jgi:MOSC domain-containing protein YiiM/GNAT superfamily N-acetyltransferase
MQGSPGTVGRVLQVNVSPGGVPKSAIESARVGQLGLEGDAHRHDTVHGGPQRAVALLGIEAIRRVRADGHPIHPGSVGENLTTEGVEWATLPAGTRAAIGETLVLEISKPAMPCNLIADSFIDGRSGRISILLHPLDSRMYARVLVAGDVRTGDEIRILAPAPDSRAGLHDLLDRIEAVGRGFNVGLWRAVASAGFDVRVDEDGGLAMVASPELPGRAFNRVSGYRELSNLLPRMIDWFRSNGTVGWIPAHEPPWLGAVAEHPASFYLAGPAAILAAAETNGHAGVPAGLTIREIGPDRGDTFASLIVEASPIDEGEAAAWRGALPRLVGSPGHHFFVVERNGEAIACANLIVRRHVGLLGLMAVLPAHRGLGIQRSLIAHRSAYAAELGATVIAASANDDSRSAENLVALGLDRAWEVALHRCDPAELPR